MTCQKCVKLLEDLSELVKKYRYSYTRKAIQDCILVLKEGSIKPIKDRDRQILATKGREL